MIKFIYCLVAFCLTHYDEMPKDFKSKFPKDIFKESSLLFSYVSNNINVFKDYGYE